MCFKKKTVPFEYKPRMCLYSAINDYPGEENDLRGCVNDQKGFIKWVAAGWPEIVHLEFKDSEVTVKNFENQLNKAISALPGVPVVFFSDSCFSGSNTRHIETSKPKFIRTHDVRGNVKKRFLKPNTIGNWIAISGCREDQTSADAYINGKYNGAASYAAMTSPKDVTWKEWVAIANAWLETHGFEQRMTIEGNEELMNKKIFSHDVIFVHFSGHGTQIRDKEGDEEDGYDEALYLYDGVFTDDRMNAILSKIQ